MGVLPSPIGTEGVVSGHGACPCASLILSAGLWGLLTVGSCAKITSFARKRPGVLFSSSLPASWLDVGGLLAYSAADKSVVALSCTGCPDLGAHRPWRGAWHLDARR